MANELREEIGGGTLAGTKRILRNSERIKGDAGRDHTWERGVGRQLEPAGR